MSDLNSTDAKFLKIIDPHILRLQEFLDKHIVGGNAMTAATIYTKYSATEFVYGVITEEDFIRGFRVALREGKPKGIEGVKGLGYKRIGEERTAANNPVLTPLLPYLERLQKFVSENIKGQVRMTSAVIYENFTKEYGCSLSKEEFMKGFGFAVLNGKITGIEGVIGSGYRALPVRLRMGTKTSEPIEFTDSVSGDEDTESDSDEDVVVEGGTGIITIDNNHRLISVDNRNWSYQIRKSSGVWMTDAYFGNYAVMLQGFARRLLDQELRAMEGFSIKELEQKFTLAENKIMDLLRNVMNMKSEKAEQK